LIPDRFFLTHAALDFTLVAIKPVSTDGKVDLAGYGFLPLIETRGKVLVDEYVAIIQHPGGATKKIALRNNKIVDVLTILSITPLIRTKGHPDRRSSTISGRSSACIMPVSRNVTQLGEFWQSTERSGRRIWAWIALLMWPTRGFA
jgi:hypothetical protein